MLDDIRPHYFYCEHCNRATSIYILSGEEQRYKCGSCGRRSRMNHKPEHGHLGVRDFGMGGIVLPEPVIVAPASERVIMSSVERAFTVRISNSTSKTKSVELFNADKVIKEKGFGLPKGVSVSVAECSYFDLLKESAESPFRVDGFRIGSDNEDQLKSFVKWRANREDGYITDMPIRIWDYYSVFQFQVDWIDVSPYSVIVNGITSFIIDIRGNTSVDIVFRVAQQVRPSPALPFMASQQLTLSPETIDRLVNG